MTSDIERSPGLPVPLSQRTWTAWVAGSVCLSGAVATWSFVSGGFAAYYVDARMGTAALLAAGLIGQFLVTIAAIAFSTKYGLESVVSTKPQLGVRGSYVALFVQYATAIGWNAVLTIFFGRSVSTMLVVTGAIPASQQAMVSAMVSALAVVGIWLMMARGAQSLATVGPVIAVTIVALSCWMFYLLFDRYGWSTVTASEPLAPYEDRLTNYTMSVELIIATTFGWWPYMGAMLRMVSSGRRALLPSMLGLGLGWTAVALVGLYAALTVGEADPTIWIREVVGVEAGVIALLFVAFANLGSTLIGAYVVTLGVSQVPGPSPG